MLHSFSDVVRVSLSPLLVAIYGHVSLVIDQLDWQRCPSPLLHCCGVVVHTDIAVFTFVSYMVAEPRGRDSSMSSVSTESQYGLRHINGVPVWNGDILRL